MQAYAEMFSIACDYVRKPQDSTPADAVICLSFCNATQVHLTLTVNMYCKGVYTHD